MACCWLETRFDDLTAQNVKAHRTKDQAVADGDERHYRGNDWADILAKQAARWGSAPVIEAVAALDIVEGWKHFYIHVGRMLNKRLLVWSKPLDKPIKDREPRKQHEHTLTYTKDFDLWHCTACLNNFRKNNQQRTSPVTSLRDTCSQSLYRHRRTDTMSGSATW